MIDYTQELDDAWTSESILAFLRHDVDAYVSYMAHGTSTYRLRTALFVRFLLVPYLVTLEGWSRDALIEEFRKRISSTDAIQDVEATLLSLVKEKDYRLILDRLPSSRWDTEELKVSFASFENRPHRFDEDVFDLAADVEKQIRMTLIHLLKHLYLRQKVEERRLRWQSRHV